MSEAWHSIMTTDPLADSDEEPHDEHVRLDYSALFCFFLLLRASKLIIHLQYAVEKFCRDIQVWARFQIDRIMRLEECTLTLLTIDNEFRAKMLYFRVHQLD